jgi:hypothetical protein
MDDLTKRLQAMRSWGKIIFFREGEAKKDKNTYTLWKKAKSNQIIFQKKHYPKMRDALGPHMRKKMWEHNIDVKTIGKGFSRIVFTGAMFANNGNIKKFHENIGVLLSDYRFKRADYKWFKGASEWTYFDLNTKKDTDI